MPDDQNGGNPPGGPGSGPLSGGQGPFPPNPAPGTPANNDPPPESIIGMFGGGTFKQNNGLAGF